VGTNVYREGISCLLGHLLAPYETLAGDGHATGLGTILLGLLAFGIESYVRFFTAGASDRVRYHHFRNGGSPDNEAVTPLRALGQIFPNVDPSVWTPVLLVILGCLTLLVYYLVPTETLEDRATLLLATILVCVADITMAVGEPILTFATMPMYGLATLYVGVLLKAHARGRETGRTERPWSELPRVVERPTAQ